MGKLIQSIYTGFWPSEKGCGESFTLAEPNEVSEQFWADDEEDSDEFSQKSNDTRNNLKKKTADNCLLCHQNLNEKSLICSRCLRRLREWMPGGVEELGLHGRLTSAHIGDRSPDNNNYDDSLYFCPIGAENQLLFSRFSNLPRFADCRPMSSSDSEIDFEIDRKKEISRRQKEKKKIRKKKQIRNALLLKKSNIYCRPNNVNISQVEMHNRDYNTNRRLCFKCKKASCNSLHSKK